jgi:hypothetical protein
MKKNDQKNDFELKLIYVLKIGYNSKGEGMYEFIFSKDETNIDIEGWMWDMEPACDNAEPPTEDFIDAIYNLKTDKFNLFCLHEAVDRPYMHGYHNIHALAYETQFSDDDSYNDYESMFGENNDNIPLLVFHYGMTLGKIKELLYLKQITLKGKEFVDCSSVELNENEDDE